MGIYFCDSSGIVKCYIAEKGSAWMTACVNPASGNVLYVVRVLGVEVISAITRRANRGEINMADAANACRRFLQDFAALFQIVEVTPALVAQAITMAQTHGLRGYDAVQLAAASEVNLRATALGLPAMTFVSADNALNQAAHLEGMPVDNPNNH